MKTYNLTRKQKFISKHGTSEEVLEMIQSVAKETIYKSHRIFDHALLILYTEEELKLETYYL